MQETKPLNVINGKNLLALDVEPPRFIIDGLMPTGLHILSGSAKVGKSWLALWLCQQIATGGKVWDFETRKSGTLYLALEDTIDRLHFRLSHITDNGSEDSHFTTEADSLSGSLIPQLEKHLQDNPDTGFIVIDTFQCIRGAAMEKNAYANDYDEVGRLKAFADRHKIALLLLHHVRKMPDSDPFNMVSGSVGIIGAADSMYVLEKDKRTDNKAVLHVTGRDIEDRQLQLEFDRELTVWRFLSYLSGEKPQDTLGAALAAFLGAHGVFEGTATELLAGLKEAGHSLAYSPNSLTRAMKEQALALEKAHHITMQFKRSKSTRTVFLALGDGDNGYTHGGTPDIASPPAPAGDGDSKYTHGDMPDSASPIPENNGTAANGDMEEKTVTPSPKRRKA